MVCQWQRGPLVVQAITRAWLKTVADRVGDYVHCMGRLVNTVVNFLSTSIAESGVRARLRDVLDHACSAAHRAPVPERLAPSSHRPSLDLTSSLYLARSVDHHSRILAVVNGAALPILTFRGRPLATAVVMVIILRGLHDMLAAWSQEAVLTPADLGELEITIRKVGDAWKALGWRVTPWVHWTVAG